MVLTLGIKDLKEMNIEPQNLNEESLKDAGILVDKFEIIIYFNYHGGKIVKGIENYSSLEGMRIQLILKIMEGMQIGACKELLNGIIDNFKKTARIHPCTKL